MGKLRALLALLAALLAGLSAAGGARAETSTGGVYITTLPSGADIWLDGTYVGRSPVVVDGLAGGRHTITITKTGWTVRELEVEIDPQALLMSSTNLVAEPRVAGRSGSEGDLSLRGVDAGTRVMLDGAPLSGDLRRPIPLLPGPHHVAITTPSGQVTRSFRIWPDTTTEVILRPPAAGEGRSAVVAPAEDYLPAGSFALEGTKIVVRYAGHVVVAHVDEATVRYDGVSLTFDSKPQTIGGRLFLPLELLEKLTAETSKTK
jgi:hypothetical protein